MNEETKPNATEKKNLGADKAVRNAAPNQRQGPQTISDPRDVATVILARMNMVNEKKDELTIAIKALSDVTQQLARAYAEQAALINRLASRVKTLEANAGAAGGNGAHPPAS